MMLGPYKLLLQIFAAIVVGAALLITAGLLLLSAGPIQISFATPYIERALTPIESPNVVRVRDTVIAWNPTEPSIDLRAIGLRVFDRDRVRLVATAPSLRVRLSVRALLRGLLAPSALEVQGATLRVQRGADGAFAVGFTSEDGQSDITATSLGFLEGLLQPPDPGSASGYMRSLGIVDATVRVDDRVNDARWTLREAAVELRRDDQAIDAEITARLDVNGLFADLSASGRFDLRERSTELAVGFEGLEPAALAVLERHARELSRAEMTVDGTLSMLVDGRGEITSVDFEIIGGPGRVNLPELYDEPMLVDALFVRGAATNRFDRLTIEEAFLDLGGVTGSARGILIRTADNRLVLSAEAETTEMPINELDRLWPRSLAGPARRWVVRNLEDGTAHTADIRLRGEAPVGAPVSLSNIRVRGGIDFSGMTVHYLRPMTPVTDAVGEVQFDNDVVSISVASGAAGNLVVEEAQIELIDLKTDKPVAEIQLAVAGPASDALALLDQDPLRFTAALGIDPAAVTGQQRTNAVFRVPLVKNLAAKQVEAAAAARISNFAYAEGILGLPIQNGDLTLEVDREQLRVSGDMDLNGTPFEVVWARGFAADEPVREQYQLRGFVDDADRAALGIELPDWISGSIGVGLTYTASTDTDGIGAAEVDLTNATIDLSLIDWRKPEGEEASGRFEFAVENDIITAVPSFAFTAPSFVAEGDMTFAPDGSFDIDRATFSRARFGETDVSGTVSVESGHYDVALAGASLDLRPFLGGDGDPAQEAAATTPVTITTLGEGIDSVRIRDDLSLTGATGQVTHDGTVVRSADVTAHLAGSQPVSLRVTGRPDGRDVVVRTEDAGELLRTLGWVETMIGGKMELEASIDDNEPGRPAFGVARIEDFQIVRGSVLARVLTLASFQGIQDVMAGNGITFRQLEIPFRLTEDAIDVKDARARGSALGILAEGRIDRRALTVDMAGEVAPAHTLNSLLGNIPILGDVLTGGGEGIFAATYKVRGPLNDPTVTVNPLSVLTPGFTRRILSGFEGGLGSGEKTDYLIESPNENN